MAPSSQKIQFLPSFLNRFLLVILSFSLIFWPIDASEDEFKLDGRVLELDDSNFDAAISKFDYVFVDFYAPWCGHCKHLAPELDKAAPTLAGLKQPIVVAKVDADKYKKLATKHDIDGYPTLKIFMHGVSTEYYGPRKAELLVQFLAKFVASDVAVLNSDSSIKEYIEAAGVNFPIFIGFGLDASTVFNLAVKYKKKAWFAVAKDFSDDITASYDFDKTPAFVAVNPIYDERSVFYGPFEETSLEDYITQSLLPLVLPINQDSLKSLKEDKRKVVLTIVEDEADEETKGVITVLKSAASANRDLIFGYVGVKQFEEFTESFEAHKETHLPKMVVWDGDEEYYTVIDTESIEQTEFSSHVSKFLESYREGSVIQKRISGLTLMGFIKSNPGAQFSLIFILVALVMVVFLLSCKEEPSTVGASNQVEAKSPTIQDHPIDKED